MLFIIIIDIIITICFVIMDSVCDTFISVVLRSVQRRIGGREWCVGGWHH